ncbi:MAG: hypothetical protein J6C26_01800 [Clostridia bacterium]|nr:hypothetical protein [Clostridia bacterium]
MKKIFSLILFALLLLSLFSGCGGSEPEGETSKPVYYGPRKILITDQKNRALSIYDIDKEDWSEPEWTWTCDEPTFTNVDGVKYRYDNNAKSDVLAFCSSGGYVAVITYPRGEVLSYVKNAGGNPHSVEILPDGALVVAASTGGYVRIYDTSGFGDVSKKYTEVSVPGAHGVLWDPEMEILWALGDYYLHAFAVTEDHKMVELKDESIALTSSIGGHDLQPIYGQPDLFWVTTNEQVLQINKRTKEISTRYDGWVTLSAMGAVKGIGNFMDGTVVLSQAAGVRDEWNTDLVHIGTLNPEVQSYEFVTRQIPKCAYYKLRVLEREYLGREAKK